MSPELGRVLRAIDSFAMDTKLNELIEQYLQETWEDQPVIASYLGIEGYDDKLGDYSADSFARRAKWNDGWYERFGGFDDHGLELDDQIDRDLIRSAIRGAQIMRSWESWKRDPGVYLGPGLQGIFTLFQHRLHPEEELVASAIARLEAIPALLEDGKKNLDPSVANPLMVERAAGQCGAGVAYFRKLVPQEVGDEKLRERISKAGEVASKAYEDFGSFIKELGTSAKGEWAIGEPRYSALLKEKEKLGYGTNEMLERGREAYDELAKEIAAFTLNWKGTEDWISVVEEGNKDHPPTEEKMREEYADWTEKARQFCKDHDLVTFPEGEECEVVPSPHFQRPLLAVASYSRPPAFQPSMKGHFFVPFAPEGTSDEEKQKRLESSQRGSIPTTSVHEAYPGHHWHITSMQENPRKIRKVIWTSYFTEGWALYTEKMMQEEGFFEEPAHELGYMVARIFRAARIVVDTSLHSGKMTFDEAVRFMMEKTGIPEPTAKAEVGRYCSWPTQAPSYLTGCLEIERMRGRWFAEGKGDLKSFHDTIARSGGLPIGLAERALLG